MLVRVRTLVLLPPSTLPERGIDHSALTLKRHVPLFLGQSVGGEEIKPPILPKHSRHLAHYFMQVTRNNDGSNQRFE